MRFHIVRKGETLDKIMFLYGLSKEEIINNNNHIRDFNKLIPGSKLKIPTITKQIDEDILEMEPFIEDYYPKNSDEKKENFELEEKPVRLTEIPKKDGIIDGEILDNKIENEKENLQEENVKESVNEKENKETIKESDKKNIQTIKKMNNKLRISYYPYYYYNPYTGKYYVYYYPLYY